MSADLYKQTNEMHVRNLPDGATKEQVEKICRPCYESHGQELAVEEVMVNPDKHFIFSNVQDEAHARCLLILLTEGLGIEEEIPLYILNTNHG